MSKKEYGSFAHNPQLDYVAAATSRFCGDLGMSAVIRPKDVIALDAATGAQWQSTTNSPNTFGQFNRKQRKVVAIARSGDDNLAHSTIIGLVSTGVHEGTHFGSLSTRTPKIHSFWMEGIAGLAQRELHRELYLLGILRPAVGLFTQGDQSSKIDVPPLFTCLDIREDPHVTDWSPWMTQGLIAAIGLSVGLQHVARTPKEVFRLCQPGCINPFVAVRNAVDLIKPGLAQEVEKCSETHGGMVVGSLLIEEAFRNVGQSSVRNDPYDLRRSLLYRVPSSPWLVNELAAVTVQPSTSQLVLTP